MADRRPLPSDPLEFIRRRVVERRIFWAYHVNMRPKDRAMSREATLASVLGCEIIEAYSEDKYLPSYLLRSQHQAIVFHVLFAVDVEGDNVRIVTAYNPDPARWDASLRTRRKP